MSPSATQDVTEPTLRTKTQAKNVYQLPVLGRQPLQLGTALDGYNFMEITRALGREYLGIQVADLIHSAEADAKLRDLGIIREFYTVRLGLAEIF